MKKLKLPLVAFVTLAILTACGRGLTTTGCRVINQEDKYVTYQTVCDHCGYEYGDPTTVHVSSKLMYSVNCTKCGEIIYVRIERN